MSFSEVLIFSNGGRGPPHAQRRNEVKIATITSKWHLFMDRFFRIFPPEVPTTWFLLAARKIQTFLLMAR
jgi:hypothetical protein